MPYRQAYMRGDYGARRGDIFSKAFGAIKGAVTGGVRSLVTGGNPITGAIVGGAAALRAPVGPAAIAPSFSQSGGPGTAMVPSQFPRPGTSMAVPGGVVATTAMGNVVFATGVGRGKHPNKSGYWTRFGYVAKGTKLVSNRHTNYGNGRALKRSLRRAHGFQHLARAVMSFTLTGRKTGRSHFKTGRKR